MGATFAHGQMRLYLLSLLADHPMHGYEMMQAIEQRSGGTYVPSAGTIYPRLAKLTEEGLVTKESRGRKTIYAITEAGRAELASRADELDAIDHEMSDFVRSVADDVRRDMRQSMQTLRQDLRMAAQTPPSRNPFESEADRGKERQGREDGSLRQAEQLVYQYGIDVRDTLRAADAAAGLSPAAVEALRDELARSLAAIRVIALR